MSIFNTKYANGIDIRGNSCYFEDIYQKNHLNDEFERVGGSGEGPSLPDWVRDNSIRFRDSDIILNGPKLNSIEEDHQKLNEIETLVLPAHEASLEELDTRVLTNSNKIAGITRPTATATLISSNNGKFYMDPNGCYVFNSASSSLTPPYLKLKPSSIELFTTASSSVYLDVNRIDKMARILQVTDSTWDTNFSITKPLLLTGTVAAANSTNKKMVVADSTSKLVNYMDIPSGSSNSNIVLTHTPSLDSIFFKNSNWTYSSATGQYTGEVDIVKKYPMAGVSSVVLDLKEAGTTFDISASGNRVEVIMFFKDDTKYNADGITVEKEKLNLSISYVASKNDLNSHLISVRMKPFPIFKNYPISGDQWTMSRMIIIEKMNSPASNNQEIHLRGKFIINNHVITGDFGELNYAWTE